MKTRINNIKKAISKDLVERDEIINISILAMLSGVSIFYYGVPGTAKSLLARRLSKIYKDNEFFDYLMNKFSTPEEVFGPLSLKALKEDRIERKTKGYLPNADVAFLDEIWKSSPAILNTLLTIINEKTFKNNGVNEKVPLKTLIAASNELPAPNQGLEALYDRFIVRLVVPNIQNIDNFEKFLNISLDDVEIDEPFSRQELKQIEKDAKQVSISTQAMNILKHFKLKLDLYNKENDEKIIISDRRFLKSIYMLKVSALLNGRKEIKPIDIMLLKHSFWDKSEQIATIEKMLKESIKNHLSDDLGDFGFGARIKQLENAYATRSKEKISNVVSRVKKFNVDYIRIRVDNKFLYIDIKNHEMHNNQSFYRCYRLNSKGSQMVAINSLIIMMKDDFAVFYTSERLKKQKLNASDLVNIKIKDLAYQYNAFLVKPDENLYKLKTISNKGWFLKGGKILSIELSNIKQELNDKKQELENEIKDYVNTSGNVFLSEKEHEIVLNNLKKALSDINHQIISLKKINF